MIEGLRPFAQLVQMAGNRVSRTKNVDEVFAELLTDQAVIDFFLTQEPHSEKIMRFIFSMGEEEINSSLMPMQKTVYMLEKYFCD